MRSYIFIFVVCNLYVMFCSDLFANSSTCEYLAKQKKYLISSERNALEKYGFVYSMKVPHGDFPSVVISEKLVPDCKIRVVIEKYFQNKISGEKLFSLKESEIMNNANILSKIVYLALVQNSVWEDSVSDNIYLIVSNEIYPSWDEWLIKYTNAILPKIEIRVFPRISIEKPSRDLVIAINAWLKNKKINQIDAAILYFIKKNGDSEKINIDVLKKDLLIRPPVDIDRFNKNFNVVNDAIQLLTRDEKISWSDIIDYYIFAYNDESL